VAKDFFLGDWQLESQKTNLNDPSVIGLVENFAWKIKDGNLTLFGTYIDENEEERAIHIEFDGEKAGKFALAVPEEEDHVVIFPFAFENRTAGYFISQGLWKDDHRSETGTYQLIVTSPASFILTIVLKNSEDQYHQINVITGRKFIEKEPPGFLQRFGMPITLFAIILFSQFMKGRTAAAPQPPAAAAPGPRPAGDSGPRITEIKDDEGDDDSGAAESDSKKDK